MASGVLRWKNGDRQIVNPVPTIGGRPNRDLLWRVGAHDGGEHEEGKEVFFMLEPFSYAQGKIVYVEYP